jgi:hypothetical protein
VIPVQDGLLLTVPPVLRLLACGIGFMLVRSCLARLLRPAATGRGGERAVRQALARLRLPALHDVVLADALGHTQIDHLVRTSQGIVVIETKTFAGWITGTLYGAHWTQHLAGCDNEFRPSSADEFWPISRCMTGWPGPRPRPAGQRRSSGLPVMLCLAFAGPWCGGTGRSLRPW